MTDDGEAIGELRADVRGLRAAFEDFRAESRRGQEKILDSLSERLNVHSRRLGQLELWRSAIAGALAVLAALWAVIKGLLPLVWPGPGPRSGIGGGP